MAKKQEISTGSLHEGHPLSLRNWGDIPNPDRDLPMATSTALDCGWGRLIFGQTFAAPADIAKVLSEEAEGQRDVAFYVREPHVVLATAPHALFLDPSHSFRLDLRNENRKISSVARGITIRSATAADEDAINRLYLARGMVPVTEGFCKGLSDEPALVMLVAAETGSSCDIAGVVMGVDHRAAFNDPDNGSSLWALAVDPQARQPGIGRSLATALADHFLETGRSFMDLSVMHDNTEAIALYEKLGFVRIPVYCVKLKNPINEKLFVGPQPEADLNIYAQIIVDEARRRGLGVEIEDAEGGLFKLSLGGRAIACRESLSDLTSAVALSRCDDKRLTRRILRRAGLQVTEQISVSDDDQFERFLNEHKRVVVKPARGEMGAAVAVDLRSKEDVENAIIRAREHCDDVIMERYVEGEDLRIIVIDGAVVAAAVRRPPAVRGDGAHTVLELIEKQSRRRQAATGGESSIPLDDETRRCVQSNGIEMMDVLEEGEMLVVRKTANLHTGGTIHDVTDALHPALADAAVRGSQSLEIPVVGFDFIVSSPSEPEYVIIEANERPGLANHEPQPTAERFIDFLFPQSRTDPAVQGVSV